MAFRLRFAATIALALLFPALANAYTVVMRGGQTIDIPDKFQITETTLTYEAAPGILVTLQLSSIDTSATDVANGSPVGTLLGHVGREFERESPAVRRASGQKAVRTLTNLDLEQTRRVRLESEAAYERRRKELGLPSREETDRLRQEESVRARQLLARSEVEQAEAETYWRARATSLRNEIFVLDSEINFMRVRLAETSDAFSGVSFATVGSPVPFIFSQTGTPGPVGVNQNTFARGQTRTLPTRAMGIPQAQIRVPIRFGSSNSIRSFGDRRHFNPCFLAPCARTFAVTFPYNYNSYDRSTIIVRLRELEAMRVGFQARWRLLEDEARRSGAQPGWLRP